MSVISVNEVKEYLNLTDNTYDERINNLIPVVQDDLCTYLNTYFQDKYVQRKSGSAIVINRDSDTNDYITDSDSYFDDKGFLANMDIAIEGGYSNVGIHTIKTAAAGQLTLKSKGAVITQDPNSTLENNYIGTIKISRINWPEGIKLTVAKMIWHLLDRPKETGVMSERIDDYSVTYAGANQYPERLIRALDKYRQVRMV